MLRFLRRKMNVIVKVFFLERKVLKVFFPKKSDIFGQLDVVMRIMVTAIGGLLEVLASRGMLKIYLNNIR